MYIHACCGALGVTFFHPQMSVSNIILQRVQNEDPRKESSFLVYCNWRAGASQPSRSTGTNFRYISLCLSGRCTYRNVLRTSKYALGLSPYRNS